MDVKNADLREVMTRNVVVAGSSATLEHVRALMLQHRISRVVIVNEYSTPVGIITYKDILRYKLDRTSKPLNEVFAVQVMSKPLVKEPETTPVRSCARRMLDSAISSVIVVRGDTLAGIVTKTDLCMFYATRGGEPREVRDVMTVKPITVRASQSMLDAAKIMTEKNITRLPVVDGLLEGIVTASDLTAANPAFTPVALRERPRDVIMWERMVQPQGASPRVIADIMTKNPITVLYNANLAEAAKLMIFHRISGLPVMDSSNQLVGILTKTDVMKALAHA